MKTLFTDLELLQAIYNLYKSNYINDTKSNIELHDEVCETCIDIKEIADFIKSDYHSVLGRIKILNSTYKEHKLFDEFDIMSEFTIDFSNLCSILSKLKEEKKNIKWTNIRSWISIGVSSLALLVAALVAIYK